MGWQRGGRAAMGGRGASEELEEKGRVGLGVGRVAKGRERAVGAVREKAGGSGDRWGGPPPFPTPLLP